MNPRITRAWFGELPVLHIVLTDGTMESMYVGTPDESPESVALRRMACDVCTTITEEG